MSSMEASNLTKDMLSKMLKAGKRFDNRDLLDFREFTIDESVSNKAEGSARIKIGKTDVAVGVKLSLGEPYPDSQDKGNLVVSGDLLPLASPRFESGPPDFDGIELPRLIDRLIRESKAIELKKLCVKEGEKVWNVFIDVYPINDDGNLIDASALAAVAALHSAFVPEITDGKIDYDKKAKTKLPLDKDILPLSFTFFKIDGSLILDPTREEQEAAESKATFGVSKYKGEYVINSCQKGLTVPFTREEIERMMEILPKKYEEQMKKLKKYLK